MRQLARREDSPSLLEGLLRRLRDLASGDNEQATLRDTLEDLLEEEQNDPQTQFTAEERALMLNALSFGELRVEDVMVPRADIKAVEVHAGLHEVVTAIKNAGHTRLLVYRETLDEVVGIVHIKDLLPFWGDGEAFDLATVMRKVLVVPPSMRVLDLLLEMRDRHTHMAAVVDEFGGTDGLVTIEDLVEEILGEINDEHTDAADPQIAENGDGSILADARVYLDELEQRLGLALLDEPERDEVDTLGGLIFTLVDRVPSQGEVIHHPAGLDLEIVEAEPRRIKRVRIRQRSRETRSLRVVEQTRG